MTTEHSALLDPRVIKALLCIASKDETRQAIGGVHFEFFGQDNYLAVATDGKKTAVVRVGKCEGWNASKENCTAVLDLPRKVCEILIPRAPQKKHPPLIAVRWEGTSSKIAAESFNSPLAGFPDELGGTPYQYPHWRQAMPRSSWRFRAPSSRSFAGDLVADIDKFFDILTRSFLPWGQRGLRYRESPSCYAIPIAPQNYGETYGWLFRTDCACNDLSAPATITPTAYLMPVTLSPNQRVTAKFLESLGL